MNSNGRELRNAIMIAVRLMQRLRDGNALADEEQQALDTLRRATAGKVPGDE